MSKTHSAKQVVKFKSYLRKHHPVTFWLHCYEDYLYPKCKSVLFVVICHMLKHDTFSLSHLRFCATGLIRSLSCFWYLENFWWINYHIKKIYQLPCLPPGKMKITSNGCASGGNLHAALIYKKNNTFCTFNAYIIKSYPLDKKKQEQNVMWKVPSFLKPH